MTKHYPKTQWGSIPVSLEGLNFLEKLFLGVAMSAALVLSFPPIALASTETGPMIFEVDSSLINTIASPDFPFGEDVLPSDKVQILREYLASKKSPMAEYAEALLDQKHYVYIIAISFAESNFCKKNIRPYNCWGIGGGYPETYENYPAAFVRSSELIEKYHLQGMDDPHLMRDTWVGWRNENWVIAVNQVISQLHELGL